MILENEQIINIMKETGWALKGRSLMKAFKFDDFHEAITFVDKLAEIAETMNHFPNIEINSNRVKLALSTYDEGGVTDQDINMAAKIDDIK